MRGKRSRPSDDVWNGHGGYMGIKKQKLVQQFQQQAQNEEKKDGIFSGISIFVNGWTTPSADELKRIMMVHGGVYHHYYNSHKTTHIIASNLPDVKMRQLKGNELIVKPEWISACLEAERLIDYKPYLLFSNKSKANKITNFTTKESPSKPEANVKAENENSNSCSSPVKQSYSPFKAKDAKDPKFLGEFFQNSRLHHISTMGANAKEYVNSLRDAHSGDFPARDKLSQLKDSCHQQSSDRTIMHIDMDCFFVSVGLRNHPELIGKPVAVCHAKGNKPSRGEEEDRLAGETRRYELQKYQEKLNGKTGGEEGKAKMSWKLENIDGLSSFSEVASCSYEARAKGVKNGMFLGPALKLCPDLQTIPYDFVGYEEVSKILYDTVASYTMDIQAVSCDEMFVDLTNLISHFNMDPLQFVSILRKEIKEKTGCACSVGLGSSILLARMATKKAKPDGQYMLKSDEVLDYMASLNVKELPGVGRSLERKLAGLNINCCGDLQAVSMSQLQTEFGKKTGAQLYKFCRGIDDRKLELQQVRKTVSAEVNYGIRFSQFQDAQNFLEQLSVEVSSRLEKIHAKGKSITLKLMLRSKDAPEETAKFLGHGVCDSVSRSIQVASYTSDRDKIFEESINMLKQVGCNPVDIRGIGISVAKLDLDEKRAANPTGNSILKFVKASTSKSKPECNDTVVNSRETHEDASRNDVSAMMDTAEDNNAIPNSAPHSNETHQKKNDNENCDAEVQEAGLDPEVLASLPEDIRQEVLRDYGRHVAVNRTSRTDVVQQKDCESVSSVKTRSNSSKSVSEDQLAKPGPSNRSLQSVRGSSSTSKQAENNARVATNSLNPSFSQIDRSVLAELPPEVRAEICLHYGGGGGGSVSSNTRSSTTTSPGKLTGNALEKLVRVSPNKRTTPVKKRRGRPPKHAVTAKAAAKSSKILNKNRKTKRVDFKREELTITNAKTEQDNREEFNEQVEGRKEKKECEEDVYKNPTFCGKSSLEEIRPLIKGWLNSTEEPVAEDVQMLVDYLQGLIYTKKMHIASIIIKCLYRNICNLSDSGRWEDTYTDLINKVQLAMKSCHGNPLFVENHF